MPRLPSFAHSMKFFLILLIFPPKRPKISRVYIFADSEMPTTQTGLLQKNLNKSKDIQRDCLYYLALAHFRLENYDEARKYVTLASRIEPNNIQVLALDSLIKDRVTKGSCSNTHKWCIPAVLTFF